MANPVHIPGGNNECQFEKGKVYNLGPRHPGPPKLRFGIWTPKEIPKTPNLRR